MSEQIRYSRSELLEHNREYHPTPWNNVTCIPQEICKANENTHHQQNRILKQARKRGHKGGKRHRPVITPNACTQPTMTTDACHDAINHHQANPKQSSTIKIAVMNCQGIISKKEVIAELLSSTNTDILICSETHIDRTIQNNEFLPKTFTQQVSRKDRTGSGGGGTLIAVRDTLLAEPMDNLGINAGTHAELCWMEIILPHNKTLCVGSLYRTPGTDLETVSILDTSMSQLYDQSPNSSVILAGDFNTPGIDWENLAHRPGKPGKQTCEAVLNLADKFNLEQQVKEPTRGNNILDLTFTNMPGIINSCHTIPGVSDHDHAVAIEVGTEVTHNKKSTRQVPVYKNANWNQIKADMLKCEKQFIDRTPENHTVEENWAFFKDCLTKSVERNIPYKAVANRKDLPWMTSETKRLIARKHRAYNTAK